MSGDLPTLHSGDSDGEVVLSNGHKVPMQILQQMYKDVTGRSERMTRQFTCNHRTQFTDLENLNTKVEHLLEQYHVAEKSCTVSFFHINESTDRHSSFDRARAAEMASLSPLENVQIEYNFLIVLPIAKKPQPYKIVIDVMSRAAIEAKMREKSNLQMRLFSAFSEQTGGAFIEYIDYAVARNLMDAISQWFEGLDQEPESKIFRWAKKWSYHFDWFAKYGTASMLSLLFLWSFSKSNHDINNSSMLYFGTLAFCSIFIFSGVALKLGNMIENAVDAYHPLSYLKINRGDDRVIASHNKYSRQSILRALFSVVLTLALNVLGSWIAIKLKIQ